MLLIWPFHSEMFLNDLRIKMIFPLGTLILLLMNLFLNVVLMSQVLLQLRLAAGVSHFYYILQQNKPVPNPHCQNLTANQ